MIDVMAMVTEVSDFLYDSGCNTCDRRDGDGDGNRCSI